MMVPSRSTKTARDFALVEVMFEAGDQFIAGDGRGTEFANNDGARVVRDQCGFERRRVASKCEREHGDRGVAGAGNVEHVARLRRDVMRVLSLFEKHDAMFPE